MTYSTIIFDLDGTLLDTLEDLADSVNFAMEKVGFPKRSIEEVKSFLGKGVWHLMSSSVPEGTEKKEIESCLSLFRGCYEEHMKNKTRPFDGIMLLLQSLKERNCKMAIVSNKYDQAVKELCGDWFKEYISVAVGESETVKRKPAPDSLLSALATLGSSAENTLYIGDSEIDVRTAKNAGIKCVGVTWGYRDRKLFESEGADYIIDTPLELLKLL